MGKQVIMSLEEYKDMEHKERQLQLIKRLARDILIEHTEDHSDWSKPDDMTETMNLDEAKLLLGRILGKEE